MSPWVWIATIGAGACGAPLRYLVQRSIALRSGSELPFGTVVVNITGSFLFGLLSGLVLDHLAPPTAQTIFGVGLLGAYTTFSTLAYEVVSLSRRREVAYATGNLLGSLVLGTIASGIGLALGMA